MENHPSAYISSSESESDEESSSSLPRNINAPTIRTSRLPRTKRAPNDKSGRGWHVLEGYSSGNTSSLAPMTPQQPTLMEGYILKRRRWPMKGWHKRYFHLEDGILKYSKTLNLLQRGRLHGTLDTGLSVISYQAMRCRLDIDDESCIHHLKIKDRKSFQSWLEALRQHRNYRQWRMDAMSNATTPLEEAERTLTADASEAFLQSLGPALQASVAKSSLDTTDSPSKTIRKKIRSIDSVDSGITILKEKLEALTILKKALEDTSKTPNDTSERSSQRSRRKYDSSNLPIPQVAQAGLPISSSNPNLNQCSKEDNPSLSSTQMLRFSPGHHRTLTEVKLPVRPFSMGYGDNDSFASTSTKAPSPQAEFVRLTTEVIADLEKTCEMIKAEKAHYAACINKLKEANRRASLQRSQEPIFNDDIKQRLYTIRHDFDALLSTLFAGNQALSFSTPNRLLTLRSRQASFLPPIRSNSIDMESLSEFYYDAEDHFSSASGSASSSEDSEADSVENDSEVEVDEGSSGVGESVNLVEINTGRRERLPVPMPTSNGFSLMNLLCKNIGRDLSKVRMPVTMHEPLSALQRLCEELEYSELLDTAVSQDSPIERMIYVAAFAVSGYASTFHRSGMKPFNPVLGETFENVRPDKGWKFMSEQVSHHPPVSSCHCIHDNWVWWQDLRLRNKFWGKSLEALPVGSVFLSFPKLKETYKWNKVTSCINNLFGEKRTIEHYGDMRITSSSGVVCQLTFHRVSSSWTGSNTTQRFQVSGEVKKEGEKSSMPLFGRWNEGIYCGRDQTARCIWRPGAIPPEHELYYGFTRFAIELNHLDPYLKKVLPRTDSRFRPDQRLLEEGNLTEAETEKLRVEAQQRTRISELPDGKEENWKPLWFERESNSGEGHRFTSEYWTTRDKDPGFTSVDLPILW